MTLINQSEQSSYGNAARSAERVADTIHHYLTKGLILEKTMQTVRNLEEASENVKAKLHKLNAEETMELIRDLKESSNNLKEKLPPILENLEKTSENMVKITDNLV